MEESIPNRLRRAARHRHEDTADQPSELRQALADLGRVIGGPVTPEVATAPPDAPVL